MNVLKLAAAAAAAVLVYGCGGGGGSTTGASATKLPVFTGTVAVGAAVTDAAVKVYDSLGVQVGEGSTDSNGNFSITLNKTGTAPYILSAVKGEITLNAIFSQTADGRINITPISDAVVTLLYPNGTDVVALLQAGTTAPTAAEIQAKQDLLKAAIAPLVQAVSTSTDIFSGTFVADGTGVDKVLDTLLLNKTLGSDGTANLELVFKTSTDPLQASTSTPTVSLTTTSTTSQVTTQAQAITITNADLPPDNMGGLYNEFIQRLNACYQLAPNVRTNGSTTVVADACKSVFVDADPTQYLQGGSRVGASGAFSSMFNYTGAVEFKGTAKPYLVQDLAGAKSADGKGRAIVSLSWVNTDGNRENISLYVTKYSLNGKDALGASGDQNRYGFFVNSHNQRFEFPLRADTSLDYVLGNYLIAVRDVNDANGNSTVKYARVTTPSGKTILLAPGAGGGQRDLRICTSTELNVVNNELFPKGSNCSGSKAITMTERFVAANDNRKPSEVFSSPALVRPLNASNLPYTPGDAEVLTWPAVGLWKLQYTFTDNTTLNQKTWSVARPMTTGELMGPAGPNAVVGRLTSANVAALKALKDSTLMVPCAQGDTLCVASEAPIPVPISGGIPMAWTSGSLPITSLWVSGAVNGKLQDGNYKSWVSGRNNLGPNSFESSARWDDQRNVSSSTTSAQVLCSRQSNADGHCASTVNVGESGDYFNYTWMSYSELWGKDDQQRTLMRSYNWFKPELRATN